MHGIRVCWICKLNERSYTELVCIGRYVIRLLFHTDTIIDGNYKRKHHARADRFINHAQRRMNKLLHQHREMLPRRCCANHVLVRGVLARCTTHLVNALFVKGPFQGILKGESGLFFTPVLTVWGGGHIDRPYGGELLCLRIWRDHSVRSAHIIFTA